MQLILQIFSTSNMYRKTNKKLLRNEKYACCDVTDTSTYTFKTHFMNKYTFKHHIGCFFFLSFEL